MRLKLWYWILVGGWHVLLLSLAYGLLKEQYAWFIGVQVLALVSLWLALRLYRALIAPLQLIESGKSALLDQDFSIKFRPTGSQELDGLVAIYNRMIDTLRNERIKTQAQQQFLQKLIAASPSGMLIMDFDSQFIDVNPAMVDLLGFNPVSEGADLPVHPLLQLCQTLEVGESEMLKLGSTDHYRVEMSAFVDRGFQRKFVQVQGVSQEVLAAEKRAYGKVIRMMAHEVNNSIGAVNALLQSFAETSMEPDEEWLKDVHEGLPIAIHRNDRLNQFMRNFADVVRLPEPQLQKTALHGLLHNCVDLMTPQAQQQQTNISIDLPDYPVWAILDTQQLEQVMINVIKNALESLKQGGQIIVSYSPNRNQISISDNGPGLSSSTDNKLFTPFFTTKPHGQGVGLTLVREVLTNHHFRFSLQTHSDGWTRFNIYLS